MPKVKYTWWQDVRAALYAFPKDHNEERKAAITRALLRIAQDDNGVDIIVLLKLVYFRHSNTLGGAAALVGIPNRTAKRRISKAFRICAEEMGFI